MSNRIGGDFNAETIEAFRAAYAQQLASPNDDEVANASGLPTNTIGNTAPWFEGVGLWKYPSGRGPDDDLKQPFNPNSYLSDEVPEGDENGESWSDEEVETLLNEILGPDDED
jgi:hypothetical protein